MLAFLIYYFKLFFLTITNHLILLLQYLPFSLNLYLFTIISWLKILSQDNLFISFSFKHSVINLLLVVLTVISVGNETSIFDIFFINSETSKISHGRLIFYNITIHITFHNKLFQYSKYLFFKNSFFFLTFKDFDIYRFLKLHL